MYSKVLIISNNPFNEENNNGKTYSSFFRGWPKNKIAQIYFNNECPSKNVCEIYFNFKNDKTVEKGDYNHKTKIKKGKLLFLKNNLKHSSIISYLYNKYWLKKIDEYEDSLMKFIEKFNPEVIFFVGGNRSFSYELLNNIYQKINIPYYIYYTDDYFEEEVNSIIAKFNKKLFYKTARRTIKNCEAIFVIGNKMKYTYENKFNKRCIPIMNSIDFSMYQPYKFKEKKGDLKIAYFGGLHLNRLDSIIKFAKIIRIDNAKNNKNTRIDIYTFTKLTEKQKEIIKLNKEINLLPGVTSDKLLHTMYNYDVLLFVESFNEKMIQKTHLSLSTKIPEYLAMGKPIFAIGPKESGSISYLDNIFNSFVVKDDKESLINEMWEELVINQKNFKKIYEYNRKYVQKYHSYESAHKILMEELSLCQK